MAQTNEELLAQKIAQTRKDIAVIKGQPNSELNEEMLAELYAQLDRLKDMQTRYQGEKERPISGPEFHIEQHSEGESENTDNEPQRLRDIVLPSALSTRYVMYFIAAAAFVILALVIFAMYATAQSCIGFIFAGVLVYMAIDMKLSYAKGKIEELAVICTSLSRDIVRNTTRVTFRTDEDIPKYYDFYMPLKSRRLTNIEPNHVYVIYFRPDNPHNLLGFTPI